MARKKKKELYSKTYTKKDVVIAAQKVKAVVIATKGLTISDSICSIVQQIKPVVKTVAVVVYCDGDNIKKRITSSVKECGCDCVIFNELNKNRYERIEITDLKK